MDRMRRAVAYCQYSDCEEYHRGTFLLNYNMPSYCATCKHEVEILEEKGSFKNKSERFKEVRVEFDYHPAHKKFKGLAIVRDESMWGDCNVYTLESALIRTDRRALKVAESLLANLNRFRGLIDEIPRTLETILNMDQPMKKFKTDLAAVAQTWEGLKADNYPEENR